MKRSRRNHGVTFKAQVALASIKGEKTLVELAEQFQIHPTQITDWKQQLLPELQTCLVVHPHQQTLLV